MTCKNRYDGGLLIVRSLALVPASSYPSAAPCRSNPSSECIGTQCVVPSPTIFSTGCCVVAMPNPRSLYKLSETSGCRAVRPGGIAVPGAPLSSGPVFR